MKSEPAWPKKTNREYDSDHASWGNADDSYSLGYDIGMDDGIANCITIFNVWLKEQKPVVLPERKQVRYENQERVQAFGDGEAKVTGSHIFYDREAEAWNAYEDELIRLIPQIR